MLIREGFRTMPGTFSLKLSCMEIKNIVAREKILPHTRISQCGNSKIISYY